MDFPRPPPQDSPMPTLKLLIPGPVTTHRRVRAAMNRDLAPWDPDFRPLYDGVRARLLALAGGDPARHVALTLPGCGHFAIEAAIRSLLPASASSRARTPS